MNKPISITYEEFKKNMADLINNSGLPAFVIEAVLQNCLHDVNAITQAQYRLDKSEYEKALKAEQKE